ncbi:MAG: hypothetical protein ACYDCQ_07905 [Dehalococcoidia bacterium]
MALRRRTRAGLVWWSPYRVAVAVAVTLGLFVRAAHTLLHDFPLNDGGLFYTMTRDLQAAHYRLPAVTSYNVEHIPFAYPPLGFYVAGLLNDITRISVTQLLRFLPLVTSALGVAAFAALAGVLLRRGKAAVAAVFCYALLPRGFIWLLMGGGLTRSFSVLFALLALWQISLMYTEDGNRHIVLATLFSTLCVLSHLETATFLVWSAALFLLIYGRHERGLIATAVLAVGTLLLTAPWWASVIAQHGREPFIAARQTGATVFSNAAVRRNLLFAVVKFGVGTTQEPLFPVIGALGALGALVCVCTGRPLLPAWWAATVLLDARAFPTYTAIPLALMAGVAVEDAVWPFVRSRLPAAVQDDSPSTGWTRVWPAMRRWWTPTVALGFLLAYATIGAAASDPRLGTEMTTLVGLTHDEQAAMRWVTQYTPANGRFLLITATAWQTDRVEEWFPALTGRRSVDTVQGTEWLPNNAFLGRQFTYVAAQGCANLGGDCLQALAAQPATAFAYVYIPRSGSSGCCSALMVALLSDPRYSLAYAGPGGTIFAH